MSICFIFATHCTVVNWSIENIPWQNSNIFSFVNLRNLRLEIDLKSWNGWNGKISYVRTYITFSHTSTFYTHWMFHWNTRWMFHWKMYWNPPYIDKEWRNINIYNVFMKSKYFNNFVFLVKTLYIFQSLIILHV